MKRFLHYLSIGFICAGFNIICGASVKTMIGVIVFGIGLEIWNESNIYK